MIRRAHEHDDEALAALDLPEDLRLRQVIDRDDRIFGAGGIVPAGAPTEPDHPLLIVRFARGVADHERHDLVEELIQLARDEGHTRLIVSCDPMSYEDVSFYESFGFKPTGRGPYRIVAGDTVQYVTGYENATGSLLDLAMAL